MISCIHQQRLALGDVTCLIDQRRPLFLHVRHSVGGNVEARTPSVIKSNGTAVVPQVLRAARADAVEGEPTRASSSSVGTRIHEKRAKESTITSKQSNASGWLMLYGGDASNQRTTLR